MGTGGAFFLALLLGLVAVGTAGLQLQTVITRWRDNGVLQAVGFTPGQIFGYYGIQLLIILIGGIAVAALISPLLPEWSPASLLTAAGLAAAAAILAALPALIWPLSRRPAELLRDTA